MPNNLKNASKGINLDAPLPELTEADLIQEVSEEELKATDYEAMYHAINLENRRLNDALDQKVKSEKELYDALNQTHQRASDVITTLTNHYTKRVELIFGIINNVQELLKEPEFKGEKE